MIYRQHPRQTGPDQTPHYGQAVNRWGVEDLDNYDAEGIFGSARFQKMERCQQYYRGSQHDYKAHNWAGNMVPRGIGGVQPLTSARDTGNEYITLERRRPAAPYRLAKKIVDSYTGLIIGEAPTYISTDPATQDCATELARCSQLHARQNQARTLGGSCGSVGLSWTFVNGMPRVRVHAGKYIHVLDWDDPEIYTVRHVTELYQTVMRAFDPKTKKYVDKLHWIRRDWTPTADIVFEAKPTDSKDPRWVPIEDQCVVHNDGYAHFVWILNTPQTEPGVYDGEPDYDGQYDQLDTLDIVNTVTVYGGIKNLDPTLVMNLDRETGGGEVVKGSTHALDVGLTGNAKYLELSGSATAAGIALTAEQRRQILETSTCVAPDENAVTGVGTSSVTLKVLYGPMTNQGSILRGQYGPGFVGIVNQMLNSMRRLAGDQVDVTEDAGDNGDGGQEQEQQTAMAPGGFEGESTDTYEVDAMGALAHEQLEGDEAFNPVGTLGEVAEDELEPGKMQRAYFVQLVPRIEEEPVLGDDGLPTGKTEVVEVERDPGVGIVEIVWPGFFPATTADDQATASAGTTATGGKAIVSQQTAVKRFADQMGLNPVEEWQRVCEERKQAEAELIGGMFPEAGGPVDDINAPPGGIPSGAVPHEVELGGSETEAVVTVNEARALFGLEPTAGPVGSMSVAAYKQQLLGDDGEESADA